MNIRNAFKIMGDNFSLCVKTTIFKIVMYSLICYLGIKILSPVYLSLVDGGFLTELNKLFKDGFFCFDTSVIIDSLKHCVTIFNDTIVSNINFTWNFALLFLLLCIILPFISGLSRMAECDVLFGSMSCNSSFGYMTSLFDNMRKAIKYEGARLFITIPYSIVCIAILYLLGKFYLLSGPFPAIATILIPIFIIAMLTFGFLMLVSYEPILIIKDLRFRNNIIECFKVTFNRHFFKKFVIIFINIFVTLLTNAFFMVYTLGVSLVITIPLSTLYMNILRMEMCYDTWGMDYYISSEYICVTKKHNQVTSMREMKYLL